MTTKSVLPDAADRGQRFLQLVVWTFIGGSAAAVIAAALVLANAAVPWWLAVILLLGAAVGMRGGYKVLRARRTLVARYRGSTTDPAGSNDMQAWLRLRRRWLRSMAAAAVVFIAGAVLVGWAAGDATAGVISAVVFACSWIIVVPVLLRVFRRYLRPRQQG